jgi:hypothetical protein
MVVAIQKLEQFVWYLGNSTFKWQLPCFSHLKKAQGLSYNLKTGPVSRIRYFNGWFELKFTILMPDKSGFRSMVDGSNGRAVALYPADQN